MRSISSAIFFEIRINNSLFNFSPYCHRLRMNISYREGQITNLEGFLSCVSRLKGTKYSPCRPLYESETYFFQFDFNDMSYFVKNIKLKNAKQ